MNNPFCALFLREWKTAWRSGGGGLTALVFFIILLIILPFSIGAEPQTLRKLGPALLWIAALLAILLNTDRFFHTDEEEGTLDIMRLSSTPFELIVITKCAAYWSICVSPLILATPFISLMYGLSIETIFNTILSLLIGTPSLILLASLGAGLTLSLKRGGFIATLLILPLTTPILIFGVLAANNINAAFLFLGAITLTSLATLPFVISLCVRRTS